MVRIFLLIILFLSGEFISILSSSSDSLTMSFEEPEGEASSTLTKYIKKRLKTAKTNIWKLCTFLYLKLGKGISA